MAYGRNYNNNRNYGGSNNGYNNNGYGNNGGGGRQRKKRTGASSGSYTNRDGEVKQYVRGWNAGKSGMTTVLCSRTEKTDQHKSNSGRTWENWMAKVQVGPNQPYITSCLYDVSSGKVIVQSLGWVINPRAANGGYCGKFSKK